MRSTLVASNRVSKALLANSWTSPPRRRVVCVCPCWCWASRATKF